MGNDLIQAQYEQLDTVAGQFGNQAKAQSELQNQLKRAMQPLQQGGWQGKGSAAFFAVMNSQILPAMHRLSDALEQARSVTLEVKVILQKADEEASNPFKANGQATQKTGSGFLSGVADFFKGAGGELWGMVKGIGNVVIHPIDTVKGLAYGIAHPSALWDAFKKPYVEAWESGHPWEAIGHGALFAGTLLLGVGEIGGAAEAAGAAGRVGEVAEAMSVAGEGAAIAETAEVASTAGRVGEAGEAANAAGKAGEVATEARSLQKLFEAGRSPKGSELADRAQQQGWKSTQTANGPLKFVDENGVVRVTIKRGSPRTPGSETPHVELRDATGQRIDSMGNPVTRRSPGNHNPIDYDLP